MSLIPDIVNAAAISFYLISPSESSMLMFRSPVISSLAPWGRSLGAARTLSIVKVSSGGEVTSDDVQSPLPRPQLEANNVSPKFMDCLYCIPR